MKITVTNINMFEQMLSMIQNFGIPSCKFNVNKTGFKIGAITDSKTFRVIVNGTFLKIKDNEKADDITFCVSDIKKLSRALLLPKLYDMNTIELDYDVQSLGWENNSSFNLILTREDIIAGYVVPVETKQVITSTFSFVTNSDTIKNIIKFADTICSTETSLVYIYNNNNKVMCEIADKKNKSTDTLKMPVGKDLDGIFDTPLVIAYNEFKSIGMLNSDNIKINNTNKNVLDIYTSEINESDSINNRVIISQLKG